jgi:hypothetical protein
MNDELSKILQDLTEEERRLLREMLAGGLRRVLAARTDKRTEPGELREPQRDFLGDKLDSRGAAGKVAQLPPGGAEPVPNIVGELGRTYVSPRNAVGKSKVRFP